MQGFVTFPPAAAHRPKIVEENLCRLRRGSRDALTQNAHRPGGERAASHQSEGSPAAAAGPHRAQTCLRVRRSVPARHRRTHQIGAHGALCQHERAFGHQENLDVGETRGLLLVFILLRVVGAAPLCADLVFNLHPSAQAPLGLDGVRMCASGMTETIWLEREAALRSRAAELSVNGRSGLGGAGTNGAVRSALRTARLRAVAAARPHHPEAAAEKRV